MNILGHVWPDFGYPLTLPSVWQDLPMSYRDPLIAAQARIRELESTVETLRAERDLFAETHGDTEAKLNAYKAEMETVIAATRRAAAEALRDAEIRDAEREHELTILRQDLEAAEARQQLDTHDRKLTEHLRRAGIAALESKISSHRGHGSRQLEAMSAKLTERDEVIDLLLESSTADAAAYFYDRLTAMRNAIEKHIENRAAALAAIRELGPVPQPGGPSASREAMLNEATRARHLAMIDSHRERVDELKKDCSRLEAWLDRCS